MDKFCEFCTVSRPVVYCTADLAYLCLSCDAKVHSANVLSGRHLRTLLCDSCRHQPAYSQCLDHLMFMCRGCEQSLHEVSPQHQKRVVSSYLGCPAAKDFAELWGFGLDELDENASPGELLLTTSSSQPGLAISEMTKISRDSQDQRNTSFLLQQILDLKRFQLSEVKAASTVEHDQEQSESSSIFYSSGNIHNGLDHSKDLGVDLQAADFQLQEIKMESLPLLFTQADQLPLPSTAMNNPTGESFWQSRSPTPNSQLWSQNMQDLGVCEDIVCRDDFKMPDFDLTFRNFEELFGGDQDPVKSMMEDKDSLCSTDKIQSHDNERVSEDISIASSVQTGHSINKCDDKGTSDQAYHLSESFHSAPTLRPSYSAMSFSISRLSAESSGNEYHDSGLSPYISFAECEDSSRSSDLKGIHLETRHNTQITRKDKKKSRLHGKQYAPRKSKRFVEKRPKGRLTTAGVNDSNTAVATTRSY